MPKALCRCGVEFASSPQRTRFCSRACYLAETRERSSESLVARFWAKVKKTPYCWLWTAGTIRGYGHFSMGRVDGKSKAIYAHRLSWIIANGPIPHGLFVLHNCPSGDNPLCVNPAHLFLGTQPDNLADARAKGRLVDGTHLIKLSDDDLATIRREYVPRKNGKLLAARYRVTLVTILRVIAGTQRVTKRHSPASPVEAVFERVPSVQVPVVGDLHLEPQRSPLGQTPQLKSVEVSR
jgi:hypothetical protein